MAETTIQTEPWMVPNFVRLRMPPRKRQDGWQEMPGLPLTHVEADVLARMCDEFRAEIFRKAGKLDPVTEVKADA